VVVAAAVALAAAKAAGAAVVEAGARNQQISPRLRPCPPDGDAARLK
jgi:hypothetical protein